MSSQGYVRRTGAVPIAVLALLLSASPALAVRGIDAPRVKKPPKMCSEALTPGMPIALRINDASETEVRGAVASIDSGGIGLRAREGNNESTVYFERQQILSIRTPNRRFPRPKSSLGGFGLGMLVGMGVALMAGYPGESSGQELPDMGGAVIVLGGATAGLIIGTARPIIDPGEKEIECEMMDSSSSRTAP